MNPLLAKGRCAKGYPVRSVNGYPPDRMMSAVSTEFFTKYLRLRDQLSSVLGLLP